MPWPSSRAWQGILSYPDMSNADPLDVEAAENIIKFCKDRGPPWTRLNKASNREDPPATSIACEHIGLCNASRRTTRAQKPSGHRKPACITLHVKAAAAQKGGGK